MSSANLLPPTVPPVEPLYPVLAAPSENFCLQKINEISNTLDHEVGHYRLVAKKYKRARNSLIGVPPAPVFSRQHFPVLVLAPLCLWLACWQQFL